MSAKSLATKDLKSLLSEFRDLKGRWIPAQGWETAINNYHGTTCNQRAVKGALNGLLDNRLHDCPATKQKVAIYHHPFSVHCGSDHKNKCQSRDFCLFQCSLLPAPEMSCICLATATRRTRSASPTKESEKQESRTTESQAENPKSSEPLESDVRERDSCCQLSGRRR